MEWRCEWCGKPHDADDPPCDNCGHGTFEKAVVRQPADEPAAESTTVWVCVECGREHPKHSPPCSRCGHAKLARREQTVDDSELTAPGYRDLVTPRYLLGLAGVIALASVFVLGVIGVIDLPGMGDGVPEVENVPGDADTYDGTSLAAVEDAYLDRIDEARAEAGAPPLATDEDLERVARAYNQKRVRSAFGDGEPPGDGEVKRWLSGTCRRAQFTPISLEIPDADASAEELGLSLGERRITGQNEDRLTFGTEAGVDVHAVEGQLWLVQVSC